MRLDWKQGKRGCRGSASLGHVVKLMRQFSREARVQVYGGTDASLGPVSAKSPSPKMCTHVAPGQPLFKQGKRGCRGSASLGHVVKLMRQFSREAREGESARAGDLASHLDLVYSTRASRVRVSGGGDGASPEGHQSANQKKTGAMPAVAPASMHRRQRQQSAPPPADHWLSRRFSKPS
jgi:hypothetical protein